MYIYFIAVFSVVILTSALLLLVFNRIKLLNRRTVLAIALSSVLSGLLFPGLFNMVSRSRPGVVDVTELMFILLSTMVLYIILAFILGIVISLVIPEAGLRAAGNAQNAGESGEIAEVGIEEGHEAVVVENAEGGNYLAEIYSSHIAENGIKDENIEETAPEGENNLEKSVDSEKNIDKMGIETISDEKVPEEDGLKAAENLSVSECVDEAFRLKELGDLEGAILYYMYALDKNPGKDLVFWVVLDICVLYKSLGQIALAQELLSSYVESYSGVMDASIKEEIERNLSYIQN